MVISMNSIPFTVFKDSATSFRSALEDGGVQCSRRFQLSEGPMASGQIIEIFAALKDATPWGAAAFAIVGWLRAKSNRKVIFTSADNRVTHIEGFSVEEVEKILATTRHAAAIETTTQGNT